jgi:hypothetical protein
LREKLWYSRACFLSEFLWERTMIFRSLFSIRISLRKDHNIPEFASYQDFSEKGLWYSRACFLSWFVWERIMIFNSLCFLAGFPSYMYFANKTNYWTKGSLFKCWSHHFESVMVHVITWLSIKDYLCHRWPLIWSVICRTHNIILISLVITYQRIFNMRNTMGSTSRVELLTLPSTWVDSSFQWVSHYPYFSFQCSSFLTNACLFISIFLFAVLSCDLQLMASNGDG